MDEAEATNGMAQGADMVLTPQQVDQVIQHAVQNQGLAVVPDEVAAELGQVTLAKVMAERQAKSLAKENEALRKQIEVMQTDMGVLHARLQEAGLEPKAGDAEVAPTIPFPGESGAAAEDGADAGEATPESIAP